LDAFLRDLRNARRLRRPSIRLMSHQDKPLKYPTILNTADVAIITKIDMTEAADCDLATLRENIQRVRPGMPIFEISSKSGEGMREWLLFVTARARESSEHAPS
jgi:hydrogenase nickel incorporation protein HypB